MPTDNPKISLYVPQAIYDAFNKFKDEQKLSMSQAGIVILAEYFGLEQIIKETTKGITIGGVTLAKFQGLNDKFLKLEEEVNRLKFTNKLQDSNDFKQEQVNGELQLGLLSKSLQKFKPIKGSLLAKRLEVARDTPRRNKTEWSTEKFYEWSKKKDPDAIGWKSEENKYLPSDELSSELLSKLQVWIEETLSQF